jgi:hypothetical protein
MVGNGREVGKGKMSQKKKKKDRQEEGQNNTFAMHSFEFL